MTTDGSPGPLPPPASPQHPPCAVSLRRPVRSPCIQASARRRLPHPAASLAASPPGNWTRRWRHGAPPPIKRPWRGSTASSSATPPRPSRTMRTRWSAGSARTDVSQALAGCGAASAAGRKRSGRSKGATRSTRRVGAIRPPRRGLPDGVGASVSVAPRGAGRASDDDGEEENDDGAAMNRS